MIKRKTSSPMPMKTYFLRRFRSLIAVFVIFFIISAGTIVVLQFHRDVYHPLGKFILEQGWVNVGSMGVSTFLASVVVLFVFVPVILIVGKYFPILLGGRRF